MKKKPSRCRANAVLLGVMGSIALFGCRDGADEPIFIINGVDTDIGYRAPVNTGGLDDSDGDLVPDAETGTERSDGLDTVSNDQGKVCSEQRFDIEYKPVKLMIALDMSGSMVTPEEKYIAARDAIGNMIALFTDRFLFGFDSYPDHFVDESCSVDGPVWFDCDIGNEDDIVDWLATHRPVSGSGDPLLLELDRFLGTPDYAPEFSDTSEEDSYLLILADGDDCCGPSGEYDCTQSWVDELAAKTRELRDNGIKTIVVGYTRNADAAALDAVAQNGGSPFDTYLPALSQTALTDALETIAGRIASCSFTIAEPDASSDPNKLNFYFDEVVVPFDDNCAADRGWTWEDDDHTTIRFCAQSCEQLNDGDVRRITAKFGCPSVIMV